MTTPRSTESTRREFLAKSAATLAAIATPGITIARDLRRTRANDRIQLAMFGVGARGSGVMQGFARIADARFVAVCDPFEGRRTAARASLEATYGDGGIDIYSDYREVMARDDVDGIVCCSCDHWHIPLAIAAARAGKDMYVEKPLGPSLAWAKVLRREAAATERVFQYGTQQRSGRAFQQVVDTVRNGRIGKIHHIDAWCIDGTRAKEWFETASRVPEPEPAGFDYDLWTGPAEKHPYNHYRVHREGSFHSYEYSIGFLGGWGAHPLDLAQWGLETDHTSPVKYEAKGKVPDGRGLYTTVYEWDARCEYESGVTLRFASHVPAEEFVMKYRKRWCDHGTTFFGTDGWISVDRQGVEASSPELLEPRFTAGEKRVEASRGHDRNFVDAMRSRKQPLSHLEAAIRSDTISHLTDIAVRTGRRLRWDPAAERIVDDEGANDLLSRTPREGYAEFLSES